MINNFSLPNLLWLVQYLPVKDGFALTSEETFFCSPVLTLLSLPRILFFMVIADHAGQPFKNFCLLLISNHQCFVKKK
jgi:hypothetical protein